MRLTAKLMAALLSASLLGGCTNIISATQDGPINSSPGQRTAGTIIEDEWIEDKILVNFQKASPSLKAAHINVVSFNENVLLVGQVPDEATRQEAQQIATSTRNVKRVQNELAIAGPTSLVIRTNDTYITSRVKVQLLAEQNIDGTRIKVITEDGTVYMMGLVSRDEADNAVKVVRTIPGVQRIVKVFEYIN